MAYLLLPLNGVGRGHLTRALIFSEWLREAGRLPMVALQGKSRYATTPLVPVTNVPNLHGIPSEKAQRVADDLAQVALMSGPACVIEDTHPRQVKWPEDIQHIIIVRPTRLDHMRLLQQRHGQSSTRLLICDHPTSPTWPYDSVETTEILSWPRWDFLGPVFRTATAEGIERVSGRYRLHPEDELFVFSMGGGGEIDGSGDRLTFLEIAGMIAAQLRRRFRRPRFIFVRGPLYPLEIPLPDIFEDQAEEPDLPSLFAVARGAVVRPGYNVTWECIAAGTPFICVPGTTRSEPVQVRLNALTDRGFETSLDVDRLIDPAARERFAAACREVMSRFSGAPRKAFLAHTELPSPPREWAALAPAPRSRPVIPAEHRERLAGAIHNARSPVPLRIRVDDVTRLDAELRWLLALCRELTAYLSLEIVPYHNVVTGLDLDKLDPDNAFEVSQHGYAHLPAYGEDTTVRGEMIGDHAGVKASEQLRWGADLLAKSFGPRFRGGYSAPYDVPPKWLAATWKSIGGSYLSWIWQRPEGEALPTVRLSVDPWGWKARAPHPPTRLVDRLLVAMRRDAGVGLVLHPQCLRDNAHRDMVTELLRCLIEAGCVPTRVDPKTA